MAFTLNMILSTANGYLGSVPQLNQLGREADDSPLYCCHMNQWSYTAGLTARTEQFTFFSLFVVSACWHHKVSVTAVMLLPSLNACSSLTRHARLLAGSKLSLFVYQQILRTVSCVGCSTTNWRQCTVPGQWQQVWRGAGTVAGMGVWKGGWIVVQCDWIWRVGTSAPRDVSIGHTLWMVLGRRGKLQTETNGGLGNCKQMHHYVGGGCSTVPALSFVLSWWEQLWP